MKKVLATVTLIIYLAFTGGVVVNFHFCMDRLASTQFYGGESKICGKCGMHKEPNGCCQDEVLVVKIDDDQQTTPVLSELSAPAISSVFTSFSPVHTGIETVKNEWQDHSPPLLGGEYIYLQNRVFRI